jgi:HD-GYP domain-containing protein (c-di-GMP phosphodiesterase class II)
MNKALIFTEDQDLALLYVSNFKVYLNFESTLYSKTKGVLESIIELKPNLIIWNFELIQLKQNYQQIFEINPQCTILYLGEKTESLPENIFAISNRFGLKEIIRMIAKLFNITAAKMNSLEVEEYFSFPTKVFRYIKKTNCNLYYKSDGKYEEVANIGDQLDEMFFSLTEDSSDIYVRSNDRLKLINHCSEFFLSELNRKDLNINDRLSVLNESYHFLSEKLYHNESSPAELQKISESCVESFKVISKEIPLINKLLGILLNNQDKYIYAHSILASFIAGKIIDNMEWGSKEQKDKVAFVMFYHDIFLAPIYEKYPELKSEDDLIFSKKLNDSEKDVVLEHAKLAAQLVRNFSRMPIGADMIISQHHGMTSGIGIAAQYKDDISPLSKVIIIAEEAASYLFSLAEKSIPVADHMENIAKKMKVKFTNKSYWKLIEAFEKADL